MSLNRGPVFLKSACVFLRTLKSNAKKVFAWGVFAWVFLRIAWVFLRISAYCCRLRVTEWKKGRKEGWGTQSFVQTRSP